MPEFQVTWAIEVDEETPEKAAQWVHDLYLVAPEYGDWVYEVTNLDTGESASITIGDYPKDDD